MILNIDFGMYTQRGNVMVARISTAAVKLAQLDGAESAWEFAYRELEKLSAAESFDEALDTIVLQNVFSEVASCSPTPISFEIKVK